MPEEELFVYSSNFLYSPLGPVQSLKKSKKKKPSQKVLLWAFIPVQRIYSCKNCARSIWLPSKPKLKKTKVVPCTKGKQKKSLVLI